MQFIVSEDQAGVDLVVEVASLIVVVGGLVDVVALQNEEEAHLARVDPPKGHASISRLPNHLMVMPLNRLGEYHRNFLFIVTSKAFFLEN